MGRFCMYTAYWSALIELFSMFNDWLSIMPIPTVVFTYFSLVLFFGRSEKLVRWQTPRKMLVDYTFAAPRGWPQADFAPWAAFLDLILLLCFAAACSCFTFFTSFQQPPLPTAMRSVILHCSPDYFHIVSAFAYKIFHNTLKSSMYFSMKIHEMRDDALVVWRKSSGMIAGNMILLVNKLKLQLAFKIICVW